MDIIFGCLKETFTHSIRAKAQADKNLNEHFPSAIQLQHKHGFTNMITVEQTYFDPETGKHMQKVEHTITFKNVLELYRTWEVFVQILVRLGFGSYGGWDQLGCEIYTILSVHGVNVGHKYVTECLNALDTKTVSNPVELLTTGRAYMFLSTILASSPNVGSPKDPAASSTKGKTVGEQCKRGAVTKKDEFASIIKRGPNGDQPSPCYNYNNGTPCVYGVDDPRYLDSKGKCAFAHICEKCGKNHPKLGNH